MNPTSRPIDITNQKYGVVGSAAPAMRDFSAITVGTIPAINRFMESSSEMNVLLSARRYEPPAMSRNEQRLENRPAEGEAENVLENDLGQASEPEHARERGAGNDATPVAGDAVHRRSQRLPPARSDVALVQAGQRLAAAEHVKERADHAGIRGQQHESPFEHRR